MRWKVIFPVLTLGVITAGSWPFSKLATHTPISVRSADAVWMAPLNQSITKIDLRTPGRLGVFVKRLRDDSVLSYQASRPWYLASTTKVLVAIALLRKSERDELALDEELTLKESDFVDGSGDLLRQRPGSRYSLEDLLGRMIRQSDSTAADLLIRRIGLSELQDEVERMLPEDSAKGFGPITTLLQVRKEAFSELHPSARNLSNLDFLKLKRVKPLKKRLQAFESILGLGHSELRARDIPEAFERYYDRNLNSGTLEAFGNLLELLAEGKLLSEENTKRLLTMMTEIETGANRIRAGLPQKMIFAQKTGTQIERVCNMGIIGKNKPDLRAEVVVTACVEKFGDQKRAEQALRDLGFAITASGVLN